MGEPHLLQLPPLIIYILSQALVPSLLFLLHSSFSFFLTLLETPFVLRDMDLTYFDAFDLILLIQIAKFRMLVSHLVLNKKKILIFLPKFYNVRNVSSTRSKIFTFFIDVSQLFTQRSYTIGIFIWSILCVYDAFMYINFFATIPIQLKFSLECLYFFLDIFFGVIKYCIIEITYVY
ncbi:hypothetical protein C1645_752395 [Glomus cerebriforme]|uniref:Uncharacterized protein n=1 Tax=Glomus cerebriforme TaxID=658196 RepID=A0A397TM17_9GLOM|nr:hypothetical protein C1645_752395 [Glomus cerebriforme]